MSGKFLEYKREIIDELHDFLREGIYDACDLISLQTSLISMIKTIQMDKYVFSSITSDEKNILIISIEIFSNKISWSLLHNSYWDYDWYEEWGETIGHYTEIFMKGGE